MEKACEALNQRCWTVILLQTRSAPPQQVPDDQDALQLSGGVMLIVPPDLTSTSRSVTHSCEQQALAPMELHLAQRSTVQANNVAPVPYGNEVLEQEWAQAMEHWHRETAVLIM